MFAKVMARAFLLPPLNTNVGMLILMHWGSEHIFGKNEPTFGNVIGLQYDLLEFIVVYHQ